LCSKSDQFCAKGVNFEPDLNDLLGFLRANPQFWWFWKSAGDWL
jgi:hypothetical protein